MERRKPKTMTQKGIGILGTRRRLATHVLLGLAELTLAGLLVLLVGLLLAPRYASATSQTTNLDTRYGSSTWSPTATPLILRASTQWSLRDAPTQSNTIERRLSLLESNHTRLRKEWDSFRRGQASEIRSRRAWQIQEGMTFRMYHIRYPWEK